jgi:hypothetical protein
MGAWEALDDSVQPQPAKIVRHHAWREMSRVDAQQWTKSIAKVTVGEAGRQVNEHENGLEESHHAWLAETEGRGALAMALDWLDDSVESVGTHGAVVGQGLDVEKTPVGVEANLRERGEIHEPLADVEV